MKCKQLTFAREYRGYTQKSLASVVDGLSQSNLSKYEHGIDTMSDELISRTMRLLGFPTTFLDLDITNNIENKHYRSKATISAAEKRKLDRTIAIIAYCFDWMSDYVELPEYNFGCFDLEEGMSPEDVATQIRRKLKLGDAPICNIITLLEANGIFVYELDTECEEFDGVSLVTDNGNHLVVINKNRSNDRKRLTLAHELGHSIMHESIDIFVNPHRNKEKEATAFAAEFLMPKNAIGPSLACLKMSNLGQMKTYWLTSMASIVERARILGVIDTKKYTTFRCEFSRNHWNKKEPLPVIIDEPSVIRQTIELITGELSYTRKQIVGCLCIPDDVYATLFLPKSNVVAMKSNI